MVADVAARDAALSLIVTVLQHCLLVKLLAAQPKQGPAHDTPIRLMHGSFKMFPESLHF